MPADGWDLLVARDNLARTRFVEHPVPDVGHGEVLLRVDRVGVTANNVTYALAGDAMSYWNFFPTDQGWGRVPLWGFADVVRSEVPGVDVTTRVYGAAPRPFLQFLTTSTPTMASDVTEGDEMRSEWCVRPESSGPYSWPERSSSMAGLPLFGEELSALE